MLEARGLTVDSARGLPALDDVGLIVHPGEVIAVVGPNGAGKTSLLRALAGLVPIRTGVVALDGEPVTRLPAHRRAAKGIVCAPERARILRGMSVEENLLAGAWRRRDRTAVAQDLYRLFIHFPALREKRRASAVRLSAAERQLVAVGRALLSAPSVLLLDEPFLGLDGDARARAIAAIREARSQERAILLTLHDLPDAREVADRVYALRAGHIVFAGSAAALDTLPAWGEIYD